ncbi:MAG: metallopeptidase TldD-related protein [Acidobacteria bacterium]|nr:metallopeptidase TldD-related protein [Acidobacteriota bacterium]
MKLPLIGWKLSRRQWLALSGGAVAAENAALAQNPAAAGAAPAQAAAPPVLLRAMLDELGRTRQLRLVSRDPVYYVEYALDDADSYTVSATLGGLLGERRNRFRLPRVTLRLGAPTFDNGNYVLSDYYFGSRFDPEQFSLDDDYNTLRQGWWLATDRAFKGAQEAIGRKRAALQNVTQNEKLPDFSAVQPQRLFEQTKRIKLDEVVWRNRVVALSAIFKRYPEALESTVDFDFTQSAAYFVNTEGTAVIVADNLAYARVRASGQAPDGMRLRDHAVIPAVDPAQLPAELDLQRAVTNVAENIKALTAAPLGANYTGPVMFEGTAAAQLFAELLSAALPAQRKPVGEPGRPVPFQPSPFEGKIGSRVLPTSFTVADDPTQKVWRGRPLLGAYAVDSEGVAAQAVTVIEKGVLKSILSTRQPARDAAASNGHARLPGSFGAKSAAISNLFVKCAEPVPAAELKTQLLKQVADRGKPYGFIIRKMDFPSSASIAEVRRLAAGSSDRPISLPLLAYRVYPDSREELVRGLRFRGVSVRSLKEILAASDTETAFDFLGNGAPFSLMGAGGFVYLSTVVAPSVLFEELELEVATDDLPRLPVVPPPPTA